MLEVDFREHPVNGGIVCSGWDGDSYPVFYRNLYQGYSLTEVKDKIKQRYGDRYKKIVFTHLPTMSI